MEKQEAISSYTHGLNLVERKNLIITGVKKIENFDTVAIPKTIDELNKSSKENGYKVTDIKLTFKYEDNLYKLVKAE